MNGRRKRERTNPSTIESIDKLSTFHKAIQLRMNLLPREIDKLLLLHQAGFLAQKRLARGCRLNKLEATALIATVLQELVRDGNHSVAELMAIGELSISVALLEEGQEGQKGSRAEKHYRPSYRRI